MTATASEQPLAAAETAGSRPILSDWRVHFWAIAGLACLLRVWYLFQIPHWPFFQHPVLDSRTQSLWAEVLVRTAGFGNPEVLAKPPLYAYFLAFIRILVGGDLSLPVARLLQLVMGSVTCGLAYLVGRRVFGVGIGMVAGLLFALYSPGIFDAGELLDTALATLLATGLLLAFLASLDKATTSRWFGTGLLLGLLGLTRGNLLLLGALMLVLTVAWLRQGPARDDLRGLVSALVAGALVVILPITARNFYLTSRLIPIATNGGVNFYTGNNPRADGYTPILSGIEWERTWHHRLPGVDETGLPRTVGALPSVEQDRFWLRQGLTFWRQHPVQALGLLMKKTYLYWAGYEIPNNVSYYWGRSRASVLRAVPLTFAAIGPLALLGIALGGWRSRGAWALTLFVFVQMVAVTAFFVCGRYRMPAVPLMCVLAAYAIVELVRRLQSRRWPALALAVIMLAVFAGLVNADLYRVGRERGANRDWYLLGQSYTFQGRAVQAREAFRRATQANPRDADAWYALGSAERRTGDIRSAASSYRRALQIAPDYSDCAASLADLALAENWPLQLPRQLLERALGSQISNVAALSGLTRLYIRADQREDAAAALAATAAAFSRWSPKDTRYPAARYAVERAAAEAHLAGVPVPLSLLPEAQSSP